MKIAVTFENGQVFQHFGHAKQFKIYEVEEGKIRSFEVIDANCSGHGAMASLLGIHNINVLICGGIGSEAQAALDDRGVEVCSGVTGDTDDAVAAYLRGELVSAGVNCHHHDHDDDSCGCGCGSESADDDCGCGCGCNSASADDDCGCGCGCSDDSEDCGCGCGCGGGCGCQGSGIEGKNVGKTCRTHYRGTFNDGTQFDSSYDRGEPLEFVCGAGMMIRGYDAAVANMEVGESIDIHLMPEEAYGPVNPAAIINVKIAEMPGSETLSVGQKVYLQGMGGQTFPVTVTAKDDETITFDANHEMAGKELNFHIELVEVL
ncbi:MAG: NifB/NifX family molybdenum-iron cluster-binding protein [Lachnospiraceae bacterium]|nr:NifB/NifX family molybdenum-iron cluster-binding protein [Lachnospiraceae bacterium]